MAVRQSAVGAVEAVGAESRGTLGQENEINKRAPPATQ